MKKDYLSVSEFSKLAKISHQGIYKQIRNQQSKLQNFIVVADGKKVISRKALELYNPTAQPEEMQPAKQPEEMQPVAQPTEQVAQPKDDDLKAVLTDTITLLSKQLVEKDKQIAEKDKHIAKLDQHLEQSQRLNENNQVLLLKQQEQKQLSEDTTEPVKKSIWGRLFNQ